MDHDDLSGHDHDECLCGTHPEENRQRRFFLFGTKLSTVKARFFRDAAAFRKWLHKHHDQETELWLGLYRKSTGRPSITWPEAVDQALCYGWIDGVRKSIDEQSYMNRFTPRRKGSNWSEVNIRRAKELIAAGLMTRAGARAFAERDEKKAKQYSFERGQVALPAEYVKQFKRNKRAWDYFEAQPPSYRKVAAWYVMSAKQEATRQRRLDRLIGDSAQGERIGPMKPKR